MPDKSVKVVNANGTHPVVLVCEHASSFIPEDFDQLGLDSQAALSHIAWDPGASAVAHHLSNRLNAVLVEGTVSRLVYDCNRPPESPTAVPSQSEIYEIPGNDNLSDAQRNARTEQVYFPFEKALAQALSDHSAVPILVTIHSFTPIFKGTPRDVEIGVLHDSDTRLADAILQGADSNFNVLRNQPYGPEDGVTHTLVHHGLKNQLLNVMIEIRNDLITSEANQKNVAEHLQRWIESALQSLNALNTNQAKGVT